MNMIVYLSLSAIAFGQSSVAREKSRDNLVSVDWLNKNLKNRDLVILDASPTQLYAKQHIPGAINYDLFIYGPRTLPVSEIETRYQSWGISLGKKIVIYDAGGTILATRLFFSLVYYGFPEKDLYILDGGFSRWQEEGLTVTSDPGPSPQKGTFTINKIRNDISVDLNEFLAASGDPEKNALVEALEADWHFGNLNVFGRPGHIPNAIMFPAANFYNPDKTFKSAEEIKRMLTYLGISPEKIVYTHCGGGIAASVPFFAIKYICGYTKVKLFPGSELEWAMDQRELPFWTYDAPYLMRDADWLKSWGGKMMRMYGISHVSFIDARASELFDKGHLEYAVNIPPNIFRGSRGDYNKLTEVLGREGVDASNEAVIISGGGLTKEAALAFVTLEKLGQKRISLFMGQAENWEKMGFKVLTNTGTSEEKKVKQNISSDQSTLYRGHLLDGIIISDIKSAKGLFSDVLIASGRNIPSQGKVDRVVHVPYTDLLKSDGTPKEAKDIWSILSGAGVPRYAQIICYSDDPGEAAANYFILKLMGFSDIKLADSDLKTNHAIDPGVK